MQSSYRDQRDRRQSREGSGERVGKERVSIRGSLSQLLCIRGHFRHGTNPSQGGRGYGRNGTKGLTYTLVYSKKYLTLSVETAITTHLRVPL